MQVVVNKLLTSYLLSGSGQRIIVLLHGWADSQATFSTLRRSLDDSYRVITLDLPGFGASATPTESWDLDQFSAFIADFLHKLELEPYAIIGHSHGGAIAIRGLAAGTLSAERLVLLASAGIRGRQKARKRALQVIAKTGKAVTRPLPASLRGHLRRKLYDTAGSDFLVSPHMQETFKKIVQQDVENDARKLQLPTLLVYGSDDTATPPAYGELLHQALGGSKLILLDGAGHFVHHDQPKPVATAVQEFLQ